MLLMAQSAQAQFIKLYDFSAENDLKYPKGDAITDGTVIYGLTTGGGANGLGTVFKIRPDGTGLTKLIDFNGTNGSNPYGSLTLSGSTLFGMTSDGGINNKGVIFKINTDGTGSTKLLDFNGTVNGAYPLGSLLVLGTVIYGMTYNGGTNDYGVVFRINTDGTGYTKLLDFDGFAFGSHPSRGLTISGSTLFGMTTSGGINGDGVIFRMNIDGSGYSTLLNFNYVNGSSPWSTLNLSGSTLYGTTIFGGNNRLGVLFKINTDGSGFSKLVDFDGSNNGAYPYQSLMLSGTVLFGMTYSGGLSNKGTIFKINTNGTGLTKLLDFTGINGANPIGSLTLSGSSLFGMTSQGGTSERGTIFRINTDGTGYYKILNCKNAPLGIYPQNTKFASDGTWLYGTTTTGGIGFGVIYKIRTDGTGYTKLFDCDDNNYGNRPSGLVLSGSTLFCETNYGGANGKGLIFKINTDGTGYSKLLDFDGPNNGANSVGLTLGGSALYGCTYSGGATDNGVIFKINADGTGHTKFMDFDGVSSGRQPNCELTLSGSTLFGTTINGGANDRGVVFKINTDGTGFTKLLDFDGVNGSQPFGSLTLIGPTLYGMTYGGGLNLKGVIFKINTDGTNFTKLFDFDGIPNGANPYGSLTLSGSTLFGMTYKGGTSDFGTFFKLNIDGSGYTLDKLLDFDGTNNGSYPQGTFYELNCALYSVTNEGGSYDGGTIFKYDLKPFAAGTISGSTSVCEGQTSVSYSIPAISNATSYVWTLPAGTIGSSTTNSISANFLAGSISGNITVKGRNSFCDGALSTYVVTVNHIPASAGAVTGFSTVVQGQTTVSYSVPAINNATSYIWNYSGSGASIAGTGNSVKINFSSSATSGNLTVYGMNSCGNGIISANYVIIVNPSPPSVGAITQPTCAIQTGSVVLNDLPATGTWILTRTPGALSSTGTGASTTISGLTPGTYTYTVKDASGLSSAASADVVIGIPKAGYVPKIKAKWGDVLICYNLVDSINSYQWYKGSSAIANAIGQYYVTNKQAGAYKVETTDKIGCKNYSNVISISGTKSLSVYPNPASVSFALKIDDAYEGRAIVSIFNSSGIKVMELQTENISEKLLKEIPVNNLDDGIYLVKVLLNNEDLYYTKIVVLK